VDSPGTAPDQHFAQIQNRSDHLQFARVPDGWWTWDGDLKNKIIQQDKHMFRATIELEHVDDVDSANN
jgi:hypothetical protein